MRHEGVRCSLQGSDTAICGILVGEKAELQRSNSGVIAELHRRNCNDFCYLNTEAQRHGEDIFKFSEETENLKTPWLCGYILHFLFWDAAYCRSLLYVRPLKNPAGRDLAGRVDFNYALCLRTDSFYNSPCCLLQRFPLGVKAKMMKIMQGTATTANTM